MLNSVLPVALGMLVAAESAPDTGTAHRTAFDAEDVLAMTRAAYAALTSYADSGTVLDESAGFTDPFDVSNPLHPRPAVPADRAP